jgi:glutathione S-transferase
MTIQVSAFGWVPPFAQGFVRDLRVRWALEEAGLPYEAALIDGAVQKTPDYRRWQPFGQVPAYRDGEVEMFESGAIVLHIAAKSEALAPRDDAGRARVASWVIAALNSLEPHIQNLVTLDVFHAGESWIEAYRPKARAMVDQRLQSLGVWLGDKDYLEGRFTAGDLMMACVLRELEDCGALRPFPNLDAYVRRCEARPAFGRAMEAQLRTFREHAPATADA